MELKPKHIPIDHLLPKALDWAFGHGLVIYPSGHSDSSRGKVTHLPFSLLPSPYPQSAFEHALRLQPLFNQLMDKVARDEAFMEECLKDIITTDEFTANLYNIWLKLRHLPDYNKNCVGMYRSDYMLHSSEEASGEFPSLYQVEFNTFSAGFANMTEKIESLHRFLSHRYMEHHEELAQIHQKQELTPLNQPLNGFIDCMVQANQLYGRENVVILLVIQINERNVFDREGLVYGLFKKAGIKCIHHTLEDIAQIAQVVGNDRRLYIKNQEISVVYFRAGYTPTDYPTQREWHARELLDTSVAIKVPNIAYHLSGCKKVQQVLAQPGVLEKFMDKSDDVKILRSCFTGLYSLDRKLPETAAIIEKALKNPENYVMKPQREGGGFNLFGEDISRSLVEMNDAELAGYILMDLIRPKPIDAYLLVEGKCEEVKGINELGIFGAWIRKDEEVILNKATGYLLRTKAEGVGRSEEHT